MSRSIKTDIQGDNCPKCKMPTYRWQHAAGFRPSPDAPYYFQYWDRCDDCGFIQHYEDAKVFTNVRSQAPSRPKDPPELAEIRAKAFSALKTRHPMLTSKHRREWLSEKLGIELRYCILAEMDKTELESVLEICAVSK